MPCCKYEYSFIVPVYNAEKYIEETAKSILLQGEGCELILINDGSTDGSGRICNFLAEKHSRIRAFHKPNGGPGGARNLGLDKARGRYCIFVDSDDYVSDNLTELLGKRYGRCNADVIFFNIVKVFPSGEQRQMAEGLKRDEICGRSAEEILKAVSKCSKFPASTGGKILKTEFLRKNNIRFADGLIGEDIDWTLQIVCNMKSADVFENANYYYRISDSGRHSYGNEKSLDDQLTITENWIKKTAKSKKKKYIFSCLAFQYAVLLPFYGALPKETRKKYKERVQSLRFLLSLGKTNKIRLIRLAVFLLGTDGASKLLYKYVTKRDEQ